MMDDTILYRDALDHLYDGVYFLDRQRKIFFWNKGADRITGYRSPDVMGRSCISCTRTATANRCGFA